MTLNKNYIKFVYGRKVYAPSILEWEKEHVEEYPEVLFDEETGEETETSNMLSYSWTERHTYYHPTRQQYAEMGWFKVVDARPETDAGEDKYWAPSGDGSIESDYEFIEPEDRPAYFSRVYTAVDIPQIEESAPEPVVRKWTRRSVKKTIQNAGLWDTFYSMMTEEDIFNFLACDYILENDEDFLAMLAKAKEAFGEDTVNALIDKIPLED